MCWSIHRLRFCRCQCESIFIEILVKFQNMHVPCNRMYTVFNGCSKSSKDVGCIASDTLQNTIVPAPPPFWTKFGNIPLRSGRRFWETPSRRDPEFNSCDYFPSDRIFIATIHHRHKRTDGQRTVAIPRTTYTLNRTNVFLSTAQIDWNPPILRFKAAFAPRFFLRRVVSRRWRGQLAGGVCNRSSRSFWDSEYHVHCFPVLYIGRWSYSTVILVT